MKMRIFLDPTRDRMLERLNKKKNSRFPASKAHAMFETEVKYVRNTI